MNNTNAAPLSQHRSLENWLSAYVSYTDDTEAPREFHLWSAISAVAGALGRKCWLDMGTFTLYPAFYIIFVAPPGIATKSTTAGQAMSLLRESKAIRLFQGSITWQAVLDELQDCGVQVKIGSTMQAMSNLQVFASELGVLLKKDDTNMVDLLVDLWDGLPRFTRRTRGGGMIDIARPFINLIGCTTPAWLSSYAESYMIDGGFFSRAIFVYSDHKDKIIAYPRENTQVELRTALEDDLKRIGQMRGTFVLSDEAKAWGTVWYEELWNNPPAELAADKFQSYRSRRQSHLHKVAMVLSAAESNSMVIDVHHMIAAEQMLILAEGHLATIHESIVTNEKLQAYRLIVKAVDKAQRIDKNKLFKDLALKLSYQEFQQGIEAAVFAGEIKALIGSTGTSLTSVKNPPKK